jgi:hypothetical protein
VRDSETAECLTLTRRPAPHLPSGAPKRGGDTSCRSRARAASRAAVRLGSQISPLRFARDQHVSGHAVAHLVRFFGQSGWSSITPTLIVEYRIQGQEQGAATSTINDELRLLVKILGLAKEASLIPAVPTVEAVRPTWEEEIAAAHVRGLRGPRRLPDMGLAGAWRYLCAQAGCPTEIKAGTARAIFR